MKEWLKLFGCSKYCKTFKDNYTSERDVKWIKDGNNILMKVGDKKTDKITQQNFQTVDDQP